MSKSEFCKKKKLSWSLMGLQKNHVLSPSFMLALHHNLTRFEPSANPHPLLRLVSYPWSLRMFSTCKIRGKVYNMVTTPKITVDFFIFKCLLWLMTQQIWLANPASRYRAQLIYSNVCYDSWPNKSEQYKKKETFTWHEWHYLKKPV